ncbi:condensation domain-containing protein, partial [Pseudomonas sp. dw_612]|uniref:condensation domain-containing protein n=1 Tax=Pseudomonas sp. dw_612 TaxID=2720080 RepID=UPI003208F7EA
MAPQGELETALADLWQDILGVERVGRHDNFFELGGHSLLAVRLISRIRQVLGGELDLTDLFATPQLHALAERVQSAATSELPAIEALAGVDALPLSFAQQRLWFLSQIEVVSATYHLPLGLRLRGRLDTASLHRSLARIYARHAALRSRFVNNDGQPQVQLLTADDWPQLVVEALPDSSMADTQLAQLCELEAQRPFDLACGPLIRARLLRLADEEHVLMLTQHHIV